MGLDFGRLASLVDLSSDRGPWDQPFLHDSRIHRNPSAVCRGDTDLSFLIRHSFRFADDTFLWLVNATPLIGRYAPGRFSFSLVGRQSFGVPQFAEGFSTCSITRTSTGPLSS